MEDQKNFCMTKKKMLYMESFYDIRTSFYVDRVFIEISSYKKLLDANVIRA